MSFTCSLHCLLLRHYETVPQIVTSDGDCVLLTAYSDSHIGVLIAAELF
jgi:hypothetical protein